MKFSTTQGATTVTLDPECECGEALSTHTITGGRNEILLCPDGIHEFCEPEEDEEEDEFLREGLPEFNGAW